MKAEYTDDAAAASVGNRLSQNHKDNTTQAVVDEQNFMKQRAATLEDEEERIGSKFQVSRIPDRPFNERV